MFKQVIKGCYLIIQTNKKLDIFFVINNLLGKQIEMGITLQPKTFSKL